MDWNSSKPLAKARVNLNSIRALSQITEKKNEKLNTQSSSLQSTPTEQSNKEDKKFQRTTKQKKSNWHKNSVPS